MNEADALAACDVLFETVDVLFRRRGGEMAVQSVGIPPSLYERDETAWLEAMSEAARAGRVEELDLIHLAEYLSDMAKRDRREVVSRLVVLMAHLLKWEHQPEGRSRSWRLTIRKQREELVDIATEGVLRLHAEEVLAKIYPKAVGRAADETGIPARLFPAVCPFTVAGLLSVELEPENV